jgi:hypothetical protein
VFVRKCNAIPVDFNSNGCCSFDAPLILLPEKCSEQVHMTGCWLNWQRLQWQALRRLMAH